MTVTTILNPRTGLKQIVKEGGRPLSAECSATTPSPVKRGPLPPERWINRELAARGSGSTLRGTMTPSKVRHPTPITDKRGPSPEQIRQWREEAGLSQRELAVKAGTMRSAVAAVEAPLTSKLSRSAYRVRVAIAEALGRVPSDWGE